MERFLLICAFGALGTGARYLVGVWAGQRFGTVFPYGTLIVNVVGCFLIALVTEIALRVSTFPPNLRLALSVGFMGGLTTYSSFGYETLKLVEDGSRNAAVVNVVVTTVACLGAVVLGLVLARVLVRA